MAVCFWVTIRAFLVVTEPPDSMLRHDFSGVASGLAKARESMLRQSKFMSRHSWSR